MTKRWGVISSNASAWDMWTDRSDFRISANESSTVAVRKEEKRDNPSSSSVKIFMNKYWIIEYDWEKLMKSDEGKRKFDRILVRWLHLDSRCERFDNVFHQRNWGRRNIRGSDFCTFRRTNTIPDFLNNPLLNEVISMQANRLVFFTCRSLT